MNPSIRFCPDSGVHFMVQLLLTRKAMYSRFYMSR